MQQQLREHLGKIVPLTEAEFAVVLTHFTYQRFRKHQTLIQPGAAVPYAYLVLSGLLKLVYTEESGKPHIIAFAMEDWWESDFQAYYTRSPATLSLECLEDTAVYCLSRGGYQQLCQDLPKLERFFLHKSISGSIAAQQRILSLLTTSAQERHDQLLRQQPALFQRVSKTQLAAYLGVSRETLSRLSS